MWKYGALRIEALLALALAFGTPAARAEDGLTFHISDFGVNQYWSDQLEVGQDFVAPDPADPEAKFHNRAFSALDGRRGAQILIPMPADADLASHSMADLSQKMELALVRQIDGARESGVREFEIQLVENVTPVGYFEQDRQRLAEAFSDAAYTAIRNVIDHAAEKQRVSVDITAASNGSHLLGHSAAAVRPFANKIGSVDIIDGRARIEEMRALIDVVGADRVTITNTAGDWWAPTPALGPVMAAAGDLARVGNPSLKRVIPPDFQASIGARQTTEQLVREYPRIRAIRLTGVDLSDDPHISSAIDENAHYRVEVTRSVGSKLERAELEGLHTRADLRHYFADPSSMPHTIPVEAPAPVRIDRARAQALIDTGAAFATMLDSLHHLNAFSPEIAKRIGPANKTLERVYEYTLMANEFWGAIQQDVEAAKDHPFVVLQSHTLETGSHLLYDKVFDDLAIPDFGVADLVVANARHAGSGSTDPETMESFLIGANKLAWGALGMVATRNPEDAYAVQQLGESMRQLGSSWSQPLFDDAARRRIAPVLAEQWRTVQIARANRGLPTQTIDQFFRGTADGVFSNGDRAQYDKELATGIQPNRIASPAIPHIRTEVRSSDQPSPMERRELVLASQLVPPGTRRVAIVGDGIAGDMLQHQAEYRFGPDHVVRIRRIEEHYRVERTAREFGADAIVELGRPDATPRISRERIDPPPQPLPIFDPPDSPPPPPKPAIDSWRPEARGVVGVMLRDAATVTGDGVALGGGSFDFLLAGSEHSLDVRNFRRFVTALWAVYMSREGPGLSIDPISPDSDKHVVRYIGSVINSDLGRVMREADYTMKKWAVGVERPDFPGFENPDDIAGRLGSVRGGMSRFWFVPDQLRFRKASSALLFDGGRMNLRTEVLSGGRDRNQANEQFASFFSEHYADLAGRYEVFAELWEYAKLVGLAQYLKQQGVPMLWYMLQNQELALTEDSPGVVDAFARRSQHFDYIEIHGGVDFDTAFSPANIVLDAETVRAFAAARSAAAPRGSMGGGVSGPSAPPAVVTVDKVSHPVVPASSVGLGGHETLADPFQTDLTLRRGGQPDLELTRYYDPLAVSGPGFGPGWHLVVPYRIEARGRERVELAGVMLPRVLRVEHELTGKSETLEFSKTRYSAAGWVPVEEDQSSLVGVFPLTNGTFRLVDRLGSEFQFDGEGDLTDMIFTNEFNVHFEYVLLDSPVARGGDARRVELQPAGREAVTVGRVVFPRALVLNGRDTEAAHFEYDDENAVVAYRPDARSEDRYAGLSVRADGSFIVQERSGARLRFDASGRAVGKQEKAIAEVAIGETRAAIDYQPSGNGLRVGAIAVRTAKNAQPTYRIRYEYGPDGRLVRVHRPGGTIDVDYRAANLRIAGR